jgi:hypothetical protein
MNLGGTSLRIDGIFYSDQKLNCVRSRVRLVR